MYFDILGVSYRQCKCDPTKPTRNICMCEGEQEVPISEQDSVNI